MIGRFENRPSTIMRTTTTLPAAMDASGGRTPPEEGAHYGYEQGTGQEVVSYCESTHHVTDEQRDHERDDAHEQGSHAVYQDLVVCAPGDEPGVDVVGEDSGGGKEACTGCRHHGGERRRQDQTRDPRGEGLARHAGEGVVRSREVGEDHPRRGSDEGAGEGVEQAVDTRRDAAPPRDLGAARREDPLPDVLPDHEPEEEEQEVGEDRLPPDRREVEVGGRQSLLQSGKSSGCDDREGQQEEEDAYSHDEELQVVIHKRDGTPVNMDANATPRVQPAPI